MQPIAWTSGQLKFGTEFWEINDNICLILISILRTSNMFSKWEGGGGEVGRRRLEFADFAILVHFKLISFRLAEF